MTKQEILDQCTIDGGTFKGSGTLVATAVVTIKTLG